IADDQLALTTSDRDHRIDRLEPGLQRLLDRLADNDAGRSRLDLASRLCGDLTLSIDRTTARIDDSADERRSHRNLEHTSRAADLVALLELQVVSKDDGADVILFEVEAKAGDLVAGLRGRHLEHLARHGFQQPVDAGDAVLDLEDRTHFLDV